MQKSISSVSVEISSGGWIKDAWKRVPSFGPLDNVHQPVREFTNEVHGWRAEPELICAFKLHLPFPMRTSIINFISLMSFLCCMTDIISFIYFKIFRWYEMRTVKEPMVLKPLLIKVNYSQLVLFQLPKYYLPKNVGT